jgi:hypothetical protein
LIQYFIFVLQFDLVSFAGRPLYCIFSEKIIQMLPSFSMVFPPFLLIVFSMLFHSFFPHFPNFSHVFRRFFPGSQELQKIPVLPGPPRDLLALLRSAAQQSAPAAALALAALPRAVAAYGAVLGRCAEEKMLGK